MRNELLQERASRQDLECDKMALERQVHTLLSGGNQLHTVLLSKLRTKHQFISFIRLLIIILFLKQFDPFPHQFPIVYIHCINRHLSSQTSHYFPLSDLSRTKT